MSISRTASVVPDKELLTFFFFALAIANGCKLGLDAERDAAAVEATLSVVLVCISLGRPVVFKK